MNSSFNQNKPNSSNYPLSWIVVGICLVVIWPLGIVLLINKLHAGFSSDRPERQNRRHQSQCAKKWSWGVGNIIESIFNAFKDDCQASSPPGGYYCRSEQTEHSDKSASNTDSKSWEQPEASSIKHKQAGHIQKDRNTNQNARQFDISQTAEETSRRLQRTGKGLGIALALIGGFFCLGGLLLTSLGISQYAINGLSASSLLELILGVFCIMGAICCFITRTFTLKRIRRFKKYAVVIGSSEVIAVSQVSRKVGQSAGKTRRTLQMMIDAEYFDPEAYIDNSLDSLVRSYDAAEIARSERDINHDAQSAASCAAEENRYVAVINELHMLGAKAPDPTICANIQTIEDLTAKIFRTVEEYPEKMTQVRRFINFYLPTTLKLLRSYELLNKQGVGGENIQSAKKDIERILDTLIIGFQQQLDHLFMSDKLDISSDIDVLENLMRRDGFTDESQMFKADGGD